MSEFPAWDRAIEDCPPPAVMTPEQETEFRKRLEGVRRGVMEFDGDHTVTVVHITGDSHEP